MSKAQKRLLRRLSLMAPDAFNSLENPDKFTCFVAVFNEYIKKVAIPKNWDFTKTIKHWPDGTGEGEGITEDGRVWYTDEKNTLLQQVLNYPDLGLFAMETYGLLIDPYAVPNKKDKRMTPYAALHLYKVSKAEALSLTRKIREDFQNYKDDKSVTDKWDEKESNEDLAFDMIERFHQLSREKKVQLSAYIMRQFAKAKGIPVEAWVSRDIDTDPQKSLQNNMWSINEVWKRKKEFWWFCLGHYGVLPTFHKDKGIDRMGLVKVPDKTLDRILDAMKSGREDLLTDEELKEMANEVKAESEANKEKDEE